MQGHRVFDLFIYYVIEAGESLADVGNPPIRFAFLSRLEVPSIC